MTLYDDRPPFHSFSVAVPAAGGLRHRLQVDEWGAPDGIAALLLHGGPGSGCTPLLRRFFDPARYRVVCPDQRGAGRSQPRGCTSSNTTADLLADLHALRLHLGLARWLVVGGSWGATLALAHALAEPQAVAALLLRALFLPGRQSIDDFFAGGPALADLAAGLNGGPGAARQAALAWWRHEQVRSGSSSGCGSAASAAAQPAATPFGPALHALVDRYRVQAHYLLHCCWLDTPPLLQRCAALPPVPLLLLHAQDDRVCPSAASAQLAALCPQARLLLLAEGGHDPTAPAMAAAMVAALDAYALRADFSGPLPA